MTAGDGGDGDRIRDIAYQLRGYRRLVDYSFLRDTGSTPEDAGARLGWGERAVEHNEARYQAREVPEWPPPPTRPGDPETAWGDACGTELGWEVHRYLNRDQPCPACLLAHYPDDCGSDDGWRAHAARAEAPCRACLLAHYPGLLSEDIATRPAPPPPGPPPPVPLPLAADPDAARHLADLAEAIGSPLPWDETSDQAA